MSKSGATTEAIGSAGPEMNKNDALIRLVSWLDHPTQLDTPLFRCLAADPRLDFQAVYCVPPGRELLPVDSEIGVKPGWDFGLLDGYPHTTIRATFVDGLRSVFHCAKGYKHFLGIVQGTNSPAFLGVLAGAWASRRKLMVRYDSTLHYATGAPSVRQRLKRLALPLLFSQVTYLGYTGEWAREYLRHYGANERQLFWFPYTVDHDLLARGAREARTQRQELRRAMGIGEDAFVFLVVAKFSPREAPLDVVRAFRLLNAPDTALVVVGDGPQRAEIRALAAEAGQGAIHLPGYVPYSQLPRYYALADVFVHPAHRGCWEVSVNEAMVCGLPVIAADTVGAAADLVEDDVNGYIYPHGQIEALCELMRRCLVNRVDLPAMGQRSQARIAGWGARETAQRLADWAVEHVRG